ncbi:MULTISPECIES: threonine synthase [unclassified Crossiella]|uniref:threonine synthase n=1 Tax=unclassified Crossiella TaxID=2620835 RepID=UPI001FFEEBE4|nr:MULTISPECIES: threonine synthase [unclassified Crossiella]MCK2242890.1 threonine synthase [Crossiella sp. S99.2]MCK2256767.1 threonine synthase [Crossiella sp. S99.1]
MAHQLPPLRCSRCATEFPVDSLVWLCPCGGVLDVADFGAKLPSRAELATRPATLWRYAESLPVPELAEVSLGEGMTPVVPAVGLPDARVKLEYLSPTLSFKDRGAVMLATLAHLLGVRRLIADSSGNAGTALSAYAARIGIPCEIYVPASTSPGKLGQMRAHGANVHLIEGNREDAARAAKLAAEAPDASYASHMFHPYFLHGTKTFAFELWEQGMPDTVVLPVGHGTLLLGAYLGFRELLAQGLIPKLPTIIGVQSANCAPLATAADAGTPGPATITPIPTKAEGIAIAEPARGEAILAAVADTGGTILGVTDDQVLKARAELAAAGFYVEPTSAVCWAAITAARTATAPTTPSWTTATPHLTTPNLTLALSGAGLKSPN